MNSPRIFRDVPALVAAILIHDAIALQVSAQPPPDQLLLKDYRPRSIYNIPQTPVPAARFRVIDMHSHPYARTDEEIAQWVKTMDAVGIEKTIILTVATGDKFDELARSFWKHPGRFSVWCGFDFTGWDQPGYGPKAVAELERCFRAGAEGVGELNDKGQGFWMGGGYAAGLHLDDPRLAPLLEKCAERRLPINVHVAEDEWMYAAMDEHNNGLMNGFRWRLDNQTNGLRHDELLDTLDRAAGRHPRTRFIACHLANCCADLSKLGKLLERHPNLHADIAARFSEIAPIPRAAARFFVQHQDRLLYGTDLGYNAEMYRITFRILETGDEHFYAWELFNYHWPLHGLDLDQTVLKKLYRDNALKILEWTGKR